MARMELVLTPQEKVSTLGQKLRDHFVQRLEECRVKNDKPMSAEARQELIAKITEVKALVRAFADAPTLKKVMPDL